MSLLQLLTTGKALEGVQNSSHRYQMTNQRLLPKFGSARNPFAAGETAASGKPVPEKAPAAPAAANPPPSIFSAGAVRQTNEGMFAKWFGAAKLMIQGWLRKPGKISPQPVAVVRPPLPTQGELLLEGIRVVRNDLSETDLEVVKARPVPVAGSPADADPVREPAERRRAWDRIRSRLAGAGKNS